MVWALLTISCFLKLVDSHPLCCGGIDTFLGTHCLPQSHWGHFYKSCDNCLSTLRHTHLVVRTRNSTSEYSLMEMSTNVILTADWGGGSSARDWTQGLIHTRCVTYHQVIPTHPSFSFFQSTLLLLVPRNSEYTVIKFSLARANSYSSRGIPKPASNSLHSISYHFPEPDFSWNLFIISDSKQATPSTMRLDHSKETLQAHLGLLGNLGTPCPITLPFLTLQLPSL